MISFFLKRLALTIPTFFALMFVTFVAFGIIALLYLVIHELLAEAREAMAGKELWWVNCVVFLGMWIVLLIDKIVGE